NQPAIFAGPCRVIECRQVVWNTRWLARSPARDLPRITAETGRKRRRKPRTRTTTELQSATTEEKDSPMKTRSAVAFAAGKPLEICEVDLEGPKEGEVLVEL